METKLLICAVEPSADALGASLVEALKKRRPNLKVIGCGGRLLMATGLNSVIDVTPFSIMGPADVLMAAPAAMRATTKLADLAASEQPIVAVFIDSWSFSRLAAKKVKKSAPSVKRIKYVAPQVWASRPGRTKTFSRYFQALLCLFEFEAPFFESSGVTVRAVGHSVFQDALNNHGDGVKFRREKNIGERPLLAVLPGSRLSELKRHGEPFGEVLRILLNKLPNLDVAVAVAPNLSREVMALTREWPVPVKFVDHQDRYDAFAAADAGLAVSGTVTTELAIHNTPMVVCYKMGLLTSLWVQHFVTTPFASLLNIAAGKEIIPEFVQNNFCVPNIAASLLPLLSAGPERECQISAFPALIEQLAGKGTSAADLAAEAILEWSQGNFDDNC